MSLREGMLNQVNPEVESVRESIIRHYRGLAALLTVAVFSCGTIITPGSSHERKSIEELFLFFRPGCSAG